MGQEKQFDPYDPEQLRRLKELIESAQSGAEIEEPIESRPKRDPGMEILPGAGKHPDARTPDELADKVKSE